MSNAESHGMSALEIRLQRESVLPDHEARRQETKGPHISPAKFASPGIAASSVETKSSEKPTPKKKGALLETRDLKKSYRKGRLTIPVLRGVDFAAEEGKITSIIGQSGSGKSTLLHLMGTLDTPDSGEIHFANSRIDKLSMRQRDALRSRAFGMIFQFYHLLPELSTLENVLTPIMISHGMWRYWSARKRFRKRAEELLEMVGLGHRVTHKPRELSGGEMQRTAIARALMAEPRILLADEPTGNLDEQTGGEIMDILKRLNREQNLTIVMVTHDNSIAEQGHAVIRLAGGRVEKGNANHRSSE
ncbi:MAG: ABC transporter ATP-binding protein [Blastopirellula sp. JB062]